MAEKHNFSEFMMTILQGIGYGKLSPTNRAYSWMEKHRTIDGPCLNFLIKNISSSNFITQKELHDFRELQNKEMLPSESEVDNLLLEYVDETANDFFRLTEDRFIENEIIKWCRYHEALELEEKFSKRERNKLQDEINMLQTKDIQDKEKLNAVIQSSDFVNELFNKSIQEIETDLANIISTTEKLNDEDSINHNIFGMNLKSFEEISKTFCETVNTILQSHFNEISNEDFSLCKQSESSSLPMGAHLRNNSEILILLAQCLGKQNYRSLKLKCEEIELNELIRFSEDLLNCSSFKSIDLKTIKRKTDDNFLIIGGLQTKIITLSKSLEELQYNAVVKRILLEKRSELENRLHIERKYLTKISELCANFVDLMTLLTCCTYNEVKNLDWAFSSIQRGVQQLEVYFQNHKDSIKNGNALFENHTKKKLQNMMNRDSIATITGLDYHSDDENRIEVVENFHNLSNIQLQKFTNIISGHDEVMDIIFNGPLYQAFFSKALSKEQILIKQQCTIFDQKYNLWKTIFNKECEKLKTDEYEKLQKSLGILFLTDHDALQNNVTSLKNHVTEITTLSKTVPAIRLRPESSMNVLTKRKGNLSSV